jgi:homoserine kinase
VHNLNALGLLIAGLADHRAFVDASMDDRLHQPYREKLLPYASPLLATLRDAGAAGACWSGAGSSMLGLADESSAPSVSDAATQFLMNHGVAGTVLTLRADRTGLVTR